MLGAELEHLLGLGDATDAGTTEVTTGHDDAEGVDGEGLLRYAYEAKSTVELEQRQVGVEVMLSGNAVEDEVERASVLRHRCGVRGDHDLVRAQAQAIGNLRRRSREEHNVSTESAGELNTHVAKAAESDNTDLLARPDLPMTQRGVGRDTGAEQRGSGREI